MSNNQHILINISKNSSKVSKIANGYTAMLLNVTHFLSMIYFAVIQLLMQLLLQTWQRHVQIVILITSID